MRGRLLGLWLWLRLTLLLAMMGLHMLDRLCWSLTFVQILINRNVGLIQRRLPLLGRRCSHRTRVDNFPCRLCVSRVVVEKIHDV